MIIIKGEKVLHSKLGDLIQGYVLIDVFGTGITEPDGTHVK